MKRALLLHGTSGSPDSFWFPWLKTGLEKKGYSVWVPQLPQADTPCVDIQLPYVLEQGQFTPETVLVAHSAGCALVLSILEKIDVVVQQVILVAGYARPLRTPGSHNDIVKDTYDWDMLQATYDWERIRAHAKEFIFICSDNDPWGADEEQSRYMFDHLSGILILRHGEGHMGSDTFHQPYKEFPLLLALIQ